MPHIGDCPRADWPIAEPIGETLAVLPFIGDQVVCLSHDQAGGRSLVIVKAEQVKKDFEGLEIKLRHRRTRQSVWSAAAYRSGAAAGDPSPGFVGKVSGP